MRAPIPRAALAALLLACCGTGGARPGGPEPPAGPSRTQVLVVGFDGLDWGVVEPLVAAGRMPNLARLVREGAAGPLRTIFPPSSPPAWTSAVTGVNPGKHGIFGFLRPLQMEGGQEKAEFATAEDREVIPVWTLLSRHGGKVGIINVPCSSPPDPVSGFMVGGFPHDPRVPVAHPPDLLRRFPRYELDVFADSPAAGNEGPWLEHLYRVEQERERLALEMLAEGGYELFWVVFTGTDRVQHFLWRLRDPKHPLHDAALAARFGDAIDRFHERMDRTLGALLAAAAPSRLTIVLSDHGMGPLYKGIAAEPLLAALNPGYRPGSFPETYLYNYFGGQVFVALRGRESFGTVAPGAPYEAVRERTIAILRGLKDPDDGQPLVTEVYRREEVYSGDAIGRAPDVLFLERDGYLATRFPSQRLTGTLPARFFSAFHRLDGVIVAAGPGVRPGTKLAGADITDVTPTVLWALGRPVPDYLDGKPLTEAFDGPTRAERPLRIVALEPAAYREARHRRSSGASPEIEEQLRSLGYIQ